MLTIERTERTSARATIAQEYFWYLRRADPEPSSYALQLPLDLKGPLDADAFARATAATIARHTVFRTTFREADKLMQVVSAAVPPFEVEREDRSALAEAEYDEVLELVATELAKSLDPAIGRTVCGRLVTFGPERHALVLMLDHAVSDAGSIFMLQREIVKHYTRGQRAAEDPVQFIDYAVALEQFADSPAGLARRAWWRDRLAGARPLALPTDFPRTEVDSRRDAAPLGIIAEPMTAMHSVEVPAATRESITRVATELGASPSVIYLSALVWLLREAAQQDDICIESLYNPRPDHGLEQIQGAVAAWTMLRCEVSRCQTLRDAIPVIKQVVAEGFAHSLIPEYFDAVPARLRGTMFNYMPAAWSDRAAKAGELQITRWGRGFPRYKRHWDLMLFVIDSTQRGVINVTGNERLRRRETLVALAERYLAILGSQLES